MVSKKYLLILAAFASLIMLPSVFAAETTISHSYPSADWSYGGNEIPETYWTPYLPLVAQEFTRFRIGFRFSTGTIAVKCPVKITFKYDTNNAQSGKDLPIKVKAELLPLDSKTFESAFGLHLPNEFQVGFIGITGVPDILPWYTLPWDLCEILSKIPGLPQEATQTITAVCRAIDNVGVNMETQNALPLPGVASYHDARTLFEFKLTDLCKTDAEKAAFKNNLGITIFNGLSNKLGPARMGKLLLLIRGLKSVNEAGATEFLTDRCMDAAGKLMDFSISTKGDPYFSVEGVELIVNLRAYIPNGKGSGTYPVVFTSSGQEQTITFRDITPFVQSGDKLVVVVDTIAYRFKLKQGLIPSIAIPIYGDINIDKYEKYVTLATAKKDFGESEFKGEIPLVPSTDPIQSLRAQPGCTSVQVGWTSPIVPLKGTIKVFDGDTLVKTVTESTYRPAHNNIILDLVKQKTYRFELSGVTESGQIIEGGSVTATTQENCRTRVQIATCNTLTLSSTPTASAGQNYADFSWTTNERASTMVLISPSPDMSANYIACVKKEGGQVTQGWVTQGGDMELVTNHSIMVADLEPGTKYYYNVVSWTFKNNNPTDDVLNRVGYVSEITTVALPEQPSMRVSVGDIGADVTVNITKVGDPAYHCSVVTGSNGQTQPVLFEPGKSYIFKVSDQACYQDYNSSPTVVIPVGAQGEQPPFYIAFEAKPPSGAYVYDTQGTPISGATATIPGYTATTNASGYYSFGSIRPVSNVTVTVSKSGYITAQVPGKVAPCRLTRTFTIDNCVMKKTAATLTAYVKKQDSTAVAGATVTVKEGSQTLSTATTDSQGKATITLNFSNTQEHNLSVTATPPTSLAGADPATENTKLTVEGQQNVYLAFIVAPPDTQGPAISGLTVTQTGIRTLHVTYNTNEDALATVYFTKPPQTTVSPSPLQWTTTYSKSYAGDIQLVNTGTYRIKGKAKDRLGNESDSNSVDYVFAGYTRCNPKVSAVTKNSATVTWDKYPYASDFKSYQLTLYVCSPGTNIIIGSALVDTPITAIATTSYNFTNLTVGKYYEAKIYVLSSVQGSLETVAFTTPSDPPQISNVSVTPAIAALGQNVKIAALITDADTPIRSISVYAIGPDNKKITLSESGPIPLQYNFPKPMPIDRTFAVNTAGDYKVYLVIKDEAKEVEGDAVQLKVLDVEQPKLAFVKSPAASCVTGEDVTFEAKVSNLGKTGKALTCALNWGDIAVEKLEVGKENIKATHKYQDAGTFNIALTASCEISEKNTLTSEPLTADVNVAAYLLPVATITDNTTDKQSNTRTLHIKATKGTYPITSWTLNRSGGNQTQSGKGDVEQDVTCNYPRKGNYEAEFVVKDLRGTEVKKEVGIRIYNDAPGTLTGHTQGTTGLQQVQDADKLTVTAKKTTTTTTTVTVDLAVLSVNAPATTEAGKQMTIEAIVKDNNDIDVNGVNVVLYAGSKKIGEQSIYMKAKDTQKVTFTYTPPSATTLTLKVSIVCPKGFRDTNTKNNSATQKVKVTAAKEGEEEKKP